MSWVKHGFQSWNATTAGCAGAGGLPCQPATPEGNAVLRVGCTDPYSATTNGWQPLGPRSEVDATTGAFPYPPIGGQSGPFTAYDERLKVDENDLYPPSNPGATYFAEVHYVAADDAAAGNGLNNASHQQVSVGAAPSYLLTPTGPFFEQRPAIDAWRVQDPNVLRADVDLAGAIVERFQVAQKVTYLGSGVWHYEYALRNHNSDRGARGFAVTFPQPATFTNLGFKDVEAHSGEPYATTDWTPTISPDAVSWSTDTYATDANANALRFSSMFN